MTADPNLPGTVRKGPRERPLREFTADSSYSWLRLAVSMAAGTIASIGMWAIVLVLPQVQADYGLARGETSMAYTATMIGFGLGNLLLGRLVDRFGIAPVLAGAGVALAAGFGLGALANDIYQFSAAQLLIGVATAAGFGPLIADVSHWFVKRRGIAVAAAASGNYLAGAIWPVVLKGVLEGAGWRTAFLIIAVVCVAALLPVAAMLRRRPPETALSPSPANAPFGQTRAAMSPLMLQILLATAGVGCCIAMAMPQVHIVAYCTDLGYGVGAGAQMLSVMLTGGIISRLTFGFIADRIGGVKTVLLGSTLQCLALFLYIPFNGLASLYVVSAIFGLSQGGIVPNYAVIVREYLPAREAGRRVGIVILATVVGMAIGGWMSGWIYDVTGSYQAAFINGIAWNMMNMAVLAFILFRTRAPREPQLAAA
ncbi:MAG: MFS transporter [Nitratireductor sp.]|nr:MFS transporter [Nitratireductor sp.]